MRIYKVMVNDGNPGGDQAVETTGLALLDFKEVIGHVPPSPHNEIVQDGVNREDRRSEGCCFLLRPFYYSGVVKGRDHRTGWW